MFTYVFYGKGDYEMTNNINKLTNLVKDYETYLINLWMHYVRTGYEEDKIKADIIENLLLKYEQHFGIKV